MIIGLLSIAFLSNDMLAAGGRKRASASGGSSSLIQSGSSQFFTADQAMNQKYGTPSPNKPFKALSFIALCAQMKVRHKGPDDDPDNDPYITMPMKLKAARPHALKGVVARYQPIIKKLYQEIVSRNII